MNNLISIITCTGGRPEAFALCQQFLNRQTVTNPIQWIIAKDTDETLEFMDLRKGIDVEVYQGNKPWRPGINTQRYNMDEAIKHVRGDYIFTFEDDDWYRKDYLEIQLYFLQKFSVVGQGNSHYYNIKERMYKQWKNYQHTSLNETGIRASELDRLDRAVNSGQLFFDMMLWDIIHKEKVNYLLYDHVGVVVGMKGLPGKTGIGGGHFPDESFMKDQMLEILRSWIGPEDTKLYIDLMMRQNAIRPV
jgi:glycosyltransferase involved in cell wall biosynthesis